MNDIAKLVADYKPTDANMDLVRQTELVLLAGIAGAGKDTITRALLETNQFSEIISHTTRPPRQNHGVMEQDGVEYHFIDQARAVDLLKEHKFIEAKYVHGNIYGTSASEIAKARQQGKKAVTDIDFQGLVEYLEIKPDTYAIFLLPPSVDTWLRRLQKRYGDLDRHGQELDKRFATSKREIEHVVQDKRFSLIVNDDLETTVARIKAMTRGEVDDTSEYAYKIAEHLLNFIETKIS